MACKHTPFPLGGQAPSRTAVPALVTVTARAEPLPEYGDRRVRVAGVGGASTRPYKFPREAGWRWRALDLPLGADVPVPGWRRGSPIPAVLLAPAAPRTQNSTFTRGQPCESRPRTPPQQGLRRPAPFPELLPGLGPPAAGRISSRSSLGVGSAGARRWPDEEVRGRRRRSGQSGKGRVLDAGHRGVCPRPRGLLATSPGGPVVPGPASGDPRRPRLCLRLLSGTEAARIDTSNNTGGKKKKKKKKIVRVNATTHSQVFLASCKGGQGRLQ